MNKDNSSSFSAHVGSRIKFYRRTHHMSLEQLACKIHKSKSTLSKYENGLIPIDVDSLYDIACALETDVSLFTDSPAPSPGNAPSCDNPFGSREGVYIYYYDGRTKRIIKTWLIFKNKHTDSNSMSVQCYMDVPSFRDYESCKYFYTGVMTYFDIVSYVTLNNQANPMEQIGLCILNPFHHTQDTWGFMFGISYNPITPFGLKFLLSLNQIADSKLTLDDLTLSKSELKMMKTLNMMLLNTRVP